MNLGLMRRTLLADNALSKWVRSVYSLANGKKYVHPYPYRAYPRPPQFELENQ